MASLTSFRPYATALSCEILEEDLVHHFNLAGQLEVVYRACRVPPCRSLPGRLHARSAGSRQQSPDLHRSWTGSLANRIKSSLMNPGPATISGPVISAIMASTCPKKPARGIGFRPFAASRGDRDYTFRTVLAQPEEFCLPFLHGQDMDHSVHRGLYRPLNSFEIDGPPLFYNGNFIAGFHVDRVICSGIHAMLDDSGEPEPDPMFGKLDTINPDAEPEPGAFLPSPALFYRKRCQHS